MAARLCMSGEEVATGAETAEEGEWTEGEEEGKDEEDDEEGDSDNDAKAGKEDDTDDTGVGGMLRRVTAEAGPSTYDTLHCTGEPFPPLPPPCMLGRSIWPKHTMPSWHPSATSTFPSLVRPMSTASTPASRGGCSGRSGPISCTNCPSSRCNRKWCNA
jgi:hypothetical protein